MQAEALHYHPHSTPAPAKFCMNLHFEFASPWISDAILLDLRPQLLPRHPPAYDYKGWDQITWQACKQLPFWHVSWQSSSQIAVAAA
jgi:hypothetical protein